MHSNQLLDCFPQAGFERLRPGLELISLPLGQVIYGPGEPIQHALFPTSCVLSLHCVLASGASAETSGVGNEGMLGVALIMGGETTSSSCMVQTAGQAWQLDRAILKQEFLRSSTVRRLLLRYTQVLIAQIAQTAACNLYHSIEQQLSRCLLLTADRGGTGRAEMTEELVARMLGVHRDSISQAAAKLMSSGCISHRRGHIAVLDHKGLESRACECYAANKRERAKLLRGRRYR